MALFLFTKALLSGQPIQVFNHGNMQRDFTYMDDIIEGVFRIMKTLPEPDPDWNSQAPDPAIYADIVDLYEAVGFRPRTSIKDGTRQFVEWYKEYYHADHRG